MSAGAAAVDLRQADEAERLYEVARGFVPRIRGLAREQEINRKLDDTLVDDMEKAGLFSVLVPKRWGGSGLGPIEAGKVTEILGSGDCSTAWVSSFYMLHNWFICRLPLETQQELYANTNSVRAAGVFGPPSVAEKVDGGYRVSGRWSYASGILHAPYSFCPAIVGDMMYWFLIPKTQLTVHDDWHMAAMSATGSCTVSADNVFVGDAWCAPVPSLMSPTDHHGTIHEEEVHQFPFSTLLMVSPSLYLGALDWAIELARGKLETSRPMGIQRITRPASRIRWAMAYEQARIMRLIRDDAFNEAVSRARAGIAPTLESEARSQLHSVALINGIKDTLQSLMDGLGSSGYRSDDPMRRMTGDAGAFATHALGPDFDNNMDRYARWILDLPAEPGDPVARIA